MFNFPFDPNKPITGKCSVIIDKSINEVFAFIGEQFFDNYPKWAVDIIEFEPLDGKEVFIGAKARQLRLDQGKAVASVFQITDYLPFSMISFNGVTGEYKDCYLLENHTNGNSTNMTYTFELLNVELFMRPFEKLIRIAIEDGAESIAENIKKLLAESI